MDSVTIRDIARKCGVGVSTVSRAMNNHPDINPQTREKILRVIRESGYVPNNSARNLKRADARAVALLVKGMDNMFFTDIIHIIERDTQEQGYACILQQVEDGENELEIALELVKEKKLRGIIFLGGSLQSSAASETADSPISDQHHRAAGESGGVYRRKRVGGQPEGKL